MNALNDARLSCASAIGAVADYVTAHSHIFVRDGAHQMTLAAVAERKSQIEQIAERYEQLKREMLVRDALTYRHFEQELENLHRLGFWPLNHHVSNVAQAFHHLELDRTARA